jgi:hypothetical protein
MIHVTDDSWTFRKKRFEVMPWQFQLAGKGPVRHLPRGAPSSSCNPIVSAIKAQRRA